MQVDLEGALNFSKFTLVATAGVDKDPQLYGKSKGISRRHYLKYNPSEELSLRLGKFMTNFGINVAEHIYSIKRQLGLDQNNESYNLELSYIGEFWNFFVSYIGGRPDELGLKRESGFSAQVAYNFLETNKIMLSSLVASNESYSRQLFGVAGNFGFSKKLYLLSEFDFQNKTSSTTSASGIVMLNKLGYEVFKGVHFNAVQEYTKLNSLDDSTRREAYGIGTQLFPRPHLDISALIQKVKSPALSPNFYDAGWLMGHYYF